MIHFIFVFLSIILQKLCQKLKVFIMSVLTFFEVSDIGHWYSFSDTIPYNPFFFFR